MQRLLDYYCRIYVCISVYIRIRENIISFRDAITNFKTSYANEIATNISENSRYRMHPTPFHLIHFITGVMTSFIFNRKNNVSTSSRITP